jgi:NhaP-type Na+/H+ or K+/H+ antiporter
MLAASSFDDIIAITVFSIFVSVAFSAAGGEGENMTVKVMIGMNIFYIITGMFFGAIIGFIMSAFNKLSASEGCVKWSKFVVMLILAILTPVFCNNTGFEESKYIGIITFGFVCYKVWGDKKPDQELAKFWKICQPFLFGTIGASVQFDSMDGSVVGYALLLICIGLIFRWFATYSAVSIERGKYT